MVINYVDFFKKRLDIEYPNNGQGRLNSFTDPNAKKKKLDPSINISSKF